MKLSRMERRSNLRRLLAALSLAAVSLAAICLGGCSGSGIVFTPLSQYWQAPMAYDDAEAPTSIGVAAVTLTVDLDPAVNRAKMATFIDKIASEKPETRIILFGETSLGHYYRPDDPEGYQRSVSETVPGTTTALIAAKALERGLYVSFGLCESQGDLLYNSQVLIGPDGAIRAVHRKANLTDWDIADGFTPGNEVAFDDIDGIKVATLICYDSMSATLLRQVASGGAKLVLLPMADLDDENFIKYQPTAQQTGAWVVGANRFGAEDGYSYMGHSFIAAPNGALRDKIAGKEGYAFAEAGIW